jgi:outer membrane protein assembly factor BamB
MKKWILNSLLLIVLALLLTSCTVQEKLLVGGCNWDQIAIVDKKTKTVEWTHQLQKGDDCNDVEITKAGNILYAYKGGARLITRGQEVIWDFKVEKGQELYTATELPSGEYLLAVCALPSRIITLNPKGEKVKEQNFDTGIANVHGQFRQIMPTSNNTYIIPLMGKGEVIELTQDGEVIRRVSVGGNPFSAKITADGNWIVGCGDAHRFVIVDPLKQLVKEQVTLSGNGKPTLLFVAETYGFKNGNVMIANWGGHSKDKTQPQLIEMDSKKETVWTLEPSTRINNISAVFPFKTKR